jgi:hypothetical protein
MPQDLGNRKMKIKLRDIKVNTKGNLTATGWTDERDIYMLTNAHYAPSEGNL